MTAHIIDGNALSKQLRAEVAQRAAALRARGITPGLAVVLVGEDPASNVYVRSKGKATREAGMESVEHRLPADVPADAVSLADTPALTDRPPAADVPVLCEILAHSRGELAV